VEFLHSLILNGTKICDGCLEEVVSYFYEQTDTVGFSLSSKPNPFSLRTPHRTPLSFQRPNLSRSPLPHRRAPSPFKPPNNNSSVNRLSLSKPSGSWTPRQPSRLNRSQSFTPVKGLQRLQTKSHFSQNRGGLGRQNTGFSKQLYHPHLPSSQNPTASSTYSRLNTLQRLNTGKSSGLHTSA
jgi:hypothetical protein